MNEVWLSLGSNCDDRARNVEKASEWLPEVIESCICSHIYETPEIHGIGTPYYNAVVRGETKLDISELNRMLKEYEVLSGRDLSARERGEVPIDIDIVIWNKEIVRPKDYFHTFFQIGYSEITEN